MATPKKIFLTMTGLAVALVAGGTLLVSLFEHVAGAATYIGAHSPVTAWTVVGVVLGAFLGLLFGRYRMGKPPKVFGAGLVGVLLVGLAASFTVRNGLAPRPTSPQQSTGPDVLYSSWITPSSGLNVREAPSSRSRVLTTIPCGESVRVAASGTRDGQQWLRILGDNDRPLGYVAARYTRRIGSNKPSCGNASEPEPPSPSREGKLSEAQQASPSEEPIPEASPPDTRTLSTPQRKESNNTQDSVAENSMPSGDLDREPASTLEMERPESPKPEPEEKEIFVVVEKSPELIGGLARLQREVEYPSYAENADIEGRVFVQFVVDENGDVQNPKVTRGVHKVLNEEAIRAVSEMKFVPGQQGGKPVKVQMSLPVTFRLQ